MINAEVDVGPASSEPYLLSKLDSFNQERKSNSVKVQENNLKEKRRE